MKTFTLLFVAFPASIFAQTTTPSSTDIKSTTTPSQSEDSFSITATGSCEPHGDHWHCPSGVAEPTTAPAIAASASHSHEDGDHEHEVTATTCEAHGDHWHCPSGLAEPTTPPAAVTTSGEGSAASTTPTPTGGASSNQRLRLYAPLIGAIGALIV